MRKYLLIAMALVLMSGNVWAANDCGADLNNNCWDCGETADDLCTARKNGTELIITGTGEMKNYGSKSITSGNPITGEALNYTNAPWGRDITSVDIKEGITSIGTRAFAGTNIENINIPSTVSSIGNRAFQAAFNLNNVVLPEGIQKLELYTFDVDISLTNITLPASLTYISEGSLGTFAESLVVPDTVTYIEGWGVKADAVVIEGTPTLEDNAFAYMDGSQTIYCRNVEACQDKGQGENVTVQAFSKTDDGFYQVGEGENAQYFLSAGSMAKQENPLNASQYQKMAKATQVNGSLLIDGKFYKSLKDFASGNYIRKRIYTVEEAEAVTAHGDKFHVFLTYK